jgi:hypothetical protein
VTTGSYTLNPVINISPGLSSSDIRYYFYIYQYNPATAVDNYICGNGGFISTISASCPITTAQEGMLLKVVLVAYHWGYKAYDTLTYFITPRTNHYLYPSTGVAFKIATDSNGLYTIGYKYPFMLSTSATAHVVYPISTTNGGLAYIWQVKCYKSGGLVNNNCTIDNKGNLLIANVSLIDKFIIYYANNICVYKGDITTAQTCTDDIAVYVINNPLQSISTSINTYLSSGTFTFNAAQFIPDYFTFSSGLFYAPILISTVFQMPSSTFSLSFATNFSFVQIQVSPLLSTSCQIKVNAVNTSATSFTNYFTATDILLLSQSAGNLFTKLDSKTLTCSFDDRYDTSDIAIRVSMDNYFLDYNLQVRFYNSGYIFVKNNRGLKFSCKHVNKFYVLKVNNKIYKRVDLDTIYGKSEANYFTAGSLITMITDVKSPANEVFDIIYAVEINPACPADKMVINVNNINIKSQNTNLTFPSYNYDHNTKIVYSPLDKDTTTYTSLVMI